MRKRLTTGRWAVAVATILASSHSLHAATTATPAAVTEGNAVIELRGRVTPYAVAEVRPHVNGVVARTLFTEGADVDEGALLFQLEPTLYETAQRTARASLERARADLTMAEANLTRSERRLLANDIIELELNEARAVAEKARAEVTVAEAELEAAESALEQTRIRAPMGGRIGKALSSRGALVTRDQDTPLAVIHQVDPICVEFEQPVSWLRDLQAVLPPGAPREGVENGIDVILLRDGGQAYPHPGKLLLNRATIDDAAGIVSFRAVFPNPDLPLLPDMTVTCQLRKNAPTAR